MFIHCIAVDFDYTLAHFLHGSKDFFRIFRRWDIPRKPLERCYNMANAVGFTFWQFLIFLRTMTSASFDKEALEVEFEAWLKEDLKPYPDSLEVLTKWHNRHIPICIITAGEETYQRHKIELMRIPYDEIIVVPRTHEKVLAVKAVLWHYGSRVAIIDDKARELDTIRSAGLTEEEVKTIHIRRPDSPYRDQVSRCRHCEISHLVEALPEFAVR